MRIDYEKLQVILAQKEMPVGKFCDKAKISRNSLSKIKNGSKSRVETVGKVARVLEVNIEEITKKE